MTDSLEDVACTNPGLPESIKVNTKRQIIPMGTSTMDNPEKLAAYDTQDEYKQKTQYGLSWTPLYANKHKYYKTSSRQDPLN